LTCGVGDVTFQLEVNMSKLHGLIRITGVGRAFVDSGNYDQGGTPTEAWNQLLGFLEENL